MPTVDENHALLVEIKQLVDTLYLNRFPPPQVVPQPTGTARPIHVVGCDGKPYEGAKVWVTTDPEGTTAVAPFVETDSSGYTPAIDLAAGTYYVWVSAGAASKSYQKDW